jgi:hypothetical protein
MPCYSSAQSEVQGLLDGLSIVHLVLLNATTVGRPGILKATGCSVDASTEVITVSD